MTSKNRIMIYGPKDGRSFSKGSPPRRRSAHALGREVLEIATLRITEAGRRALAAKA